MTTLMPSALDEARELTEAAHRAAVDRLPEPVRLIAGYHAGWWDAAGRPASSNGKAVRPALVLACARAVGGSSAAAVPAAVAVELAHDFSLLHDDVMDGDLTRRHRPAAWTLFGVGPAVLTGDLLLTLATDVLVSSGIPGAGRVLAGGLLDLCRGQAADLAFEETSSVRLDQCLAMAEGKTGALLGVACELGALAGGADSGTAGAFRLFGRRLGVAFQLVDDLLGIWGDPAVTGKPAGSDLLSRKKTLPVVWAMGSGTPAGDRLAALYSGDELDVALAAELIAEAGGREWARREAVAWTSTALAEIPLDADLRALAYMMTNRER